MEMSLNQPATNSHLHTDTIAAIATPPGNGGIAVIRLSGPDALSILSAVWRGADPEQFKSHTLHLGEIINPADGETIDQVVAAYFKAPKSFTGEHTIEISCHGSGFIQEQIMRTLIAAGARTAGPGEFTQRAFLNGRIDLSQAEAIADLIAARSRAAHSIAIAHTKGNFARRLAQMRESLIELASLLELELDFSEEDVTFADRARLDELTAGIIDEIDSLRSSYAAGHAISQGINVAIAGQPNAGKSTLLNKITHDNKAIVSDIPGTTRDTIDATTIVSGIEIRFTDTAGLRQTDETIEQLGIQRAIQTIQRADIVLWLIDATDNLTPQIDLLRRHLPDLRPDRLIILLTKTDLLTPDRLTDITGKLTDAMPGTTPGTTPGAPDKDFGQVSIHAISAATGQGIDTLLQTVTNKITGEYDPRHDLMISNVRHYKALTAARASLQRLRSGLRPGIHPGIHPGLRPGLRPNTTDDITNGPSTDNTYGLSSDLLAQDLREAIAHLGAITGSVTSADILTTIFSRFCIGK